MTSHGWLLLSLFLPLPLLVALYLNDPRASDLPRWIVLIILLATVLRLVALVQVIRRRWRGVLLGLIPSGMTLALHLADSLGALPPQAPTDSTVSGFNGGMVALSLLYFTAAWAARSHRGLPES